MSCLFYVNYVRFMVRYGLFVFHYQSFSHFYGQIYENKFSCCSLRYMYVYTRKCHTHTHMILKVIVYYVLHVLPYTLCVSVSKQEEH
jgi:hypothetical protein